MSRFRPCAALLLFLPLLGCASWSGVRFAPSPFEVKVAPDAGAPALGRAVFSWRGIEREEAGYGARFHVRVQNDAATPLRLAPTRCELVDGALTAFGAPYIERIDETAPSPDWTIPPGEAVIWSMSFPFAGTGDPADMDLSGLHFTLALSDERGGINVSASFDRLRYERGGWSGSVFYGSGWHVRGGRGVSFGIGTTVHH